MLAQDKVVNVYSYDAKNCLCRELQRFEQKNVFPASSSSFLSMGTSTRTANHNDRPLTSVSAAMQCKRNSKAPVFFLSHERAVQRMRD
eukprot:4776810-Amphidinium_carterae.1